MFQQQMQSNICNSILRYLAIWIGVMAGSNTILGEVDKVIQLILLGTMDQNQKAVATSCSYVWWWLG